MTTYSVILEMKLSADTHRPTRITLFECTDYDMAVAFANECNHAVDYKETAHVARKAFDFVQSISGNRAYGSCIVSA